MNPWTIPDFDPLRYKYHVGHSIIIGLMKLRRSHETWCTEVIPDHGMLLAGV